MTNSDNPPQETVCLDQFNSKSHAVWLHALTVNRCISSQVHAHRPGCVVFYDVEDGVLYGLFPDDGPVDDRPSEFTEELLLEIILKRSLR